jgi:hypothetical protein
MEEKYIGGALRDLLGSASHGHQPQGKLCLLYRGLDGPWAVDSSRTYQAIARSYHTASSTTSTLFILFAPTGVNLCRH